MRPEKNPAGLVRDLWWPVDILSSVTLIFLVFYLKLDCVDMKT